MRENLNLLQGKPLERLLLNYKQNCRVLANIVKKMTPLILSLRISYLCMQIAHVEIRYAYKLGLYLVNFQSILIIVTN